MSSQIPNSESPNAALAPQSPPTDLTDSAAQPEPGAPSDPLTSKRGTRVRLLAFLALTAAVLAITVLEPRLDSASSADAEVVPASIAETTPTPTPELAPTPIAENAGGDDPEPVTAEDRVTPVITTAIDDLGLDTAVRGTGVTRLGGVVVDDATETHCALPGDDEASDGTVDQPVETAVATAEAEDSAAEEPDRAEVDTEAPAEEPAETEDPQEPQAPLFHSDNFDAADPLWRSLSGSWDTADGQMTQSDATGYDYINELAVSMPERALIEVDMQALDTPLGGGMIVAQPTPLTRAGAFVVDFTEGGQFLRWGGYDADTALYTYMGGVAMSAGFDPAAPHQLGVELTPDGTKIFVDGKFVGEFGALPAGRVGLVTSLSAVAFDNFTVTELANDDA